MKTASRFTAPSRAKAPPTAPTIIPGTKPHPTRKEVAHERWALIETLLSLEGYELVPDLFEHSIRRRKE